MIEQLEEAYASFEDENNFDTIIGVETVRSETLVTSSRVSQITSYR